LAQSYQEAEAQYGKESAVALTKQAELMRMKIPEYSNYFDSGNVNLSTQGRLSYRFGHVYHSTYDLYALPSESKLVEDLSHLLDAYEALFYRGGRDSDNIHVEESESIGEIISYEEIYKKRVHLRTERPSSSKIKRIKKKLGFICQACMFNFEETYGNLGREYIEAHHLVPISDLKKGEKRKVTEYDFAVLCSNCHRMIHRQANPGDLEKLKSHIRS
jgi:5-methylcytosine-specific restriction protein A